MTPAEARFYVVFLRRFCTSSALDRLVAEHAVAPDGHCRTCRATGSSTGGVVGPCTLLRLATAARKQ